MKALSILQPWPWLITRPDITDPIARAKAYAEGKIKDIENRVWNSHYRGDFLIHASATYSRKAHAYFAEFFADEFQIILPKYEDLPTGGIVGRVTMVDCVRDHASRWKNDEAFGFVLKNAIPLRFVRWTGQRRFFNVPESAINGLVIPGNAANGLSAAVAES